VSLAVSSAESVCCCWRRSWRLRQPRIPWPWPPLPGPGRRSTLLIRDSLFAPAVVRIAPGTTVVWHYEGRNPHTVIADDGSWDSGFLGRGQTYRRTFDKPGRYAYHCRPHGGVDGKGDVDAAMPGDLMLVAPGVYRESVVVLTPDLTIRGLDRNLVILDGEFGRDNGIKVLAADNVVVENMTARFGGGSRGLLRPGQVRHFRAAQARTGGGGDRDLSGTGWSGRAYGLNGGVRF